jgi:hypothetical protein
VTRAMCKTRGNASSTRVCGTFAGSSLRRCGRPPRADAVRLRVPAGFSPPSIVVVLTARCLSRRRRVVSPSVSTQPRRKLWRVARLAHPCRRWLSASRCERCIARCMRVADVALTPRSCACLARPVSVATLSSATQVPGAAPLDSVLLLRALTPANHSLSHLLMRSRCGLAAAPRSWCAFRVCSVLWLWQQPCRPPRRAEAASLPPATPTPSPLRVLLWHASVVPCMPCGRRGVAP